MDRAKGVPDVAAALAGARDIVSEQVAEETKVRARTRRVFQRVAGLVSRKAR